MNFEEQLDARNEAMLDLPDCANCEHPYHAGECEHERGDVWVEGKNADGWVAQGPCGCTNFEAMDSESAKGR